VVALIATKSSRTCMGSKLSVPFVRGSP
jgi:hypothetical protein